MALSAICIALFHRERTGSGQYIDVSMLDGAVTWLYATVSDYFSSGKVPKKRENFLDGKYAFYNVYETKDHKYLSVGAVEKKFWKEICQLAEKPEWIELHDAPAEIHEKLKQELAEFIKTKDQQEWLDLSQKKDTCVGPVYDIDELFSDPHILERGLLTEMNHPVAGKIRQIKMALPTILEEHRCSVFPSFLL